MVGDFMNSKKVLNRLVKLLKRFDLTILTGLSKGENIKRGICPLLTK